MKTLKMNLTRLHNEEHAQFQTEFKNSVDKYDATELDIAESYQAYLPFFAQEQEALQLIRKSAATKKITDADRDRDTIFRGFGDAIKSTSNHFNVDKQAAANHVKVLLDQYGNVARKPYNEETAAINKLVTELGATYKADITLLALTDWVQELDDRNKAFDALMKGRYSEEASKTELRMLHVRLDIDEAYNAIINRLDALMLLNGVAKYEAFARELNAHVEKYKNTVATRQGRAEKKNEAVAKK
jgi:hypothetical protein